MDRRAFLIAAGRVGLAAGAGAVGLTVSRALAPIVTARPGVTLRRGPTTPPIPGLVSVRSNPAGSAPPHANLVRRENAMRGTDRWLIGGLPATIQGYLDRASVAPGDRLTLRVDAQA